MIIVNPVIAASSGDDWLSGEVLCFYTKLMEYPANKLLNELLPHHKVGEKLKRHELDAGFAPNYFFYTDVMGIMVVSIGVVPSQTDTDIDVAVSDFRLFLNEQPHGRRVFFVTGARNIPGATAFLDGIKNIETVGEIAPRELSNEIIEFKQIKIEVQV
jgi:hypothetical protein